MPPRLSDKLRAKGATVSKPKLPPLWDGPQSDSPQGGITQSMMNDYLFDRERFRIGVMEGLAAADTFSKPLEFGNLWHICEEAHAANLGQVERDKRLIAYCKELIKKYKKDAEEIEKWYFTCKTQYPIYVDYWSKQKDVLKRIPVFQEVAFNIPYKLEVSGRVVQLRGKYDSVDVINKKIWLQENKTKGQIYEHNLIKQLLFDLQTMTYLCALRQDQKNPKGYLAGAQDESTGNLLKMPIGGVRYNVIRRPHSGGKGSIRKHAPTKSNPAGETNAQYFARLTEVFNEDRGYWFMRWSVEVSSQDMDRFEREFLQPCLETICNDYDWWDHCYNTGRSPFDHNKRMLRECFGPRGNYHYRLPYGIYNPIAEGAPTDLDEYLATGSTVGLRRAETLFPELEV